MLLKNIQEILIRKFNISKYKKFQLHMGLREDRRKIQIQREKIQIVLMAEG